MFLVVVVDVACRPDSGAWCIRDSKAHSFGCLVPQPMSAQPSNDIADMSANRNTSYVAV